MGSDSHLVPWSYSFTTWEGDRRRSPPPRFPSPERVSRAPWTAPLSVSVRLRSHEETTAAQDLSLLLFGIFFLLSNQPLYLYVASTNNSIFLNPFFFAFYLSFTSNSTNKTITLTLTLWYVLFPNFP